MKHFFRIGIFFIIFFSLSGCTDVTTDTHTTTTTSHTEETLETVDPVIARELKDRIDDLYDSNHDQQTLKIVNDFDAVVSFTNSHVSLGYYEYNEELVYSFKASDYYYYKSFSDTRSEEVWTLLEMNQDVLMKYHSRNEVISLSETDATLENYERNIEPHQRDYYYFFLETMDYTKIDENHYEMEFPYSALENEPNYEAYFEDFYVDGTNENDHLMVTIQYTFTESSLRFRILFEIYVDDDLLESVSVDYTSTLTFPETIERFSFDINDYYQQALTDELEYASAYPETQEAKVYLVRNKDNIVKYHLTPGYYYFDCELYRSGEIYITDADGTEYHPRNYIKILDEGDYYVHVKVSESGKNKIEIDKASTENFVQVDNPIVFSGNEISGSLDFDESTYFLLDTNSSGYVLEITLTQNTTESSRLTVNNSKWFKTIGTKQYLLVEEGEDFIFKIYANQATNYTLEISQIPIDAGTTTDIDQMDELPFLYDGMSIPGQNFCFGPSDYAKTFKFTITEQGYYKLRVYFVAITTNYSEYGVIFPDIPLYTEDGTLVMADFEGLEYELSPGTYYLLFQWYEDCYACGYVYLYPYGI